MKVIIINSPLFRECNRLYDEDSLPPIGLGYIATILHHNNIDVELIDAVDRRLSLQQIIQMLEEKQPEFIALNIFTTNYDIVYELVESISFSTHFIIGGLSTKQLYNKIVSWNTQNQIDIVTGDGELITLDIVNNCVKDVPFFSCENRRVFKIDTSSHYLVNDISNVPLNRSFFSNEPVKHPLGFTEANIVASRGCVYNCTFCAAARSLNKDYPVRERTNASLINELISIKETFPSVNSIRVLDDLFLKNNCSVQKAIDVFSQFEFQWRSMAHVMTFKNVDDNLMRSLKASGCYELFIGIESGSPTVLSSINKTKDVSTIIQNLTKVFKAGINIKGYFIYGFPNEDENDMKLTFALADQLKNLSLYYGVNFRTSVFQYRPYHGTQIYHDLEQEGTNLNVLNIAPNRLLSNLVGRQQFNFHSGNYSSVSNEVLHDYIYRTINLNDGKIFARLRSKSQSV
ncbi:hypothetical protein CAP35_01370 [Chitinophagaceae bacterium IBVUCB1]|nr:hypothetical protein CAP35_01370 [Chitinophagaceae bacterium IBVUCB1]